MTPLAKYLDKQGHGSLSRAAKYLNVEPSTLLRWKRGTWKPGPDSALRIRIMMDSKLDFRKKVTAQSTEVKATRKAQNAKIAAK